MKSGEKIRRRRLEMNMTMEQLGNAIGVQRSAINKYEKGIVDMKSSTLSAIARVLQVSLVSLLDDEDDIALDELLDVIYRIAPKNRTLAKNILYNLIEDEDDKK